MALAVLLDQVITMHVLFKYMYSLCLLCILIRQLVIYNDVWVICVMSVISYIGCIQISLPVMLV